MKYLEDKLVDKILCLEKKYDLHHLLLLLEITVQVIFYFLGMFLCFIFRVLLKVAYN